MYKQNLALNNLQVLIGHENPTNLLSDRCISLCEFKEWVLMVLSLCVLEFVEVKKKI